MIIGIIIANIYPDLMIKMLSRNKKKSIFLPDFSGMIGVRVYLHTTFLVGEIADRFLGQVLYT